jgi:hypothetical protein
MRLNRTQQERAETDVANALSISARCYWRDVCLYSPAERGKKIAQLERAARKLPAGGAAHLLRSLERQGYI